VEEFDAAAQAYQQAEMIASDLTIPFIANYLVVARGNLALAHGNLEDAYRVLSSSRRKLKNSQSSYERGLWALMEGRYYLYKNEPRKAIPFLMECKELFVHDGRDLELHWCMVWLTAAREGVKDRENARKEIREFLSANAIPDHALLVTLGQAAPWLKELQADEIVGRPLVTLLEKIQRQGMKLPAIRRALRRHASFVQPPPAGLVIRALGNPEVSLNGKVISMPEWRTQSVRDLFFFFLHRQDAVTKEQVGAMLWPETRDAQALKARFKNEIYRLRRAAGRDIIVFDDEYYRFNRKLDYEYDVEAFDSHLVRSSKTSDLSNRIEHLQKAVDLYQGPYLADVDSEWTVHERERLARAYTSALEELAYRYLNANQLERCLSVCLAALQRDRFHETIYQIRMRAHAALGDRAAVVREYQACRTSMQELGILPSAETEQLFNELTGLQGL
jgi:two-component SAPR family response regulator